MLTEETQEMTACLAAAKMLRVDDAVVALRKCEYMALEAFSRWRICVFFFTFTLTEI